MKNFKKIIFVLIMIVTLFCFSFSVSAVELDDWSSGVSANLSGIGSGEWSSGYVGLKVNIVTKDKKIQKKKIFINKTCSGCKYATQNSKVLASDNYSAKWETKSSSYVTVFDDLPNDWCTSKTNKNPCATTLNMYDWLSKNDYRNLNKLLKEMNINESNLIDYYNSYILVEPMVRIGTDEKLFGTAFEFGKSKYNDKEMFEINDIGRSETFAYRYAKNVFGGNGNGGAKLLYSTIYVKTEIEDLGVLNYKKWLEKHDYYGVYGEISPHESRRRNYCITKGRTCGRAIGIFGFPELYNYHTLTIKKSFPNKSESPKTMTFSVKKWNGSAWVDIKKSCTANISSGKGSCKITGLIDGYYKIFESGGWSPECTSGCYDDPKLLKFKIDGSDPEVNISNKKLYTLTVNKKFINPEEATPTVKFILQRWYNGVWNNTDKYCEARITNGKGNCNIKDLKKGTYRLIEDGFSTKEWEIKCTENCVRVTASIPIKVDVASNTTIVVENRKRLKENYELVINKVDKGTGQLITENPAEIYLYNGSDCSGSIINLNNYSTKNVGYITISNLVAGNYSVRENKAPKGYEKDSTCHNIVVDDDKEISIENSRSCQIEFDDIKKIKGSVPMTDRIALYHTYPQNRNLLNLNNDDAIEACSQYDPNFQKEISCLSSALDTNKVFNQRNLSNYNGEKIFDIGGVSVTGYCLTELNFNKKANTDDDFNTYAGGILAKAELATELNLNKKCYLYNYDKENGYTEYTGVAPIDIELLKYYVYDVKLGGEELSIKNDNIVNPSEPSTEDDQLESQENLNELIYTKLSGETNLYGFTTTKQYKFPSLYAQNGSGKIQKIDCENCKPLGYGIKTNLNQSSGGILNFTFQSDFSSNITDWTNIPYGSCQYTVIPKLIKENKIDLEFRSISTSNPFPGKTGTQRKVGTNWRIIEDSIKGNGINDEIITQRPNSYGLIPETGEKKSPKYVIELSPADIRSIREHNKGITYDDYNLECIEEGKVCTSYYLTELKENGVISVLNNEKRTKL